MWFSMYTKDKKMKKNYFMYSQTPSWLNNIFNLLKVHLLFVQSKKKTDIKILSYPKLKLAKVIS